MYVWVVARLPQRLKSRFVEIFFFALGHLQGPSTRKNITKCWFWPLRQTVHCPAKMDFFLRFSSLCNIWFIIIGQCLGIEVPECHCSRRGLRLHLKKFTLKNHVYSCIVYLKLWIKRTVSFKKKSQKIQPGRTFPPNHQRNNSNLQYKWM